VARSTADLRRRMAVSRVEARDAGGAAVERAEGALV
jgi:hypothetical protein